MGPPGAPPRPSAPAGDVVALDALDLEIGVGEFFGLLGPNGAGKTTTIGIVILLAIAGWMLGMRSFYKRAIG